MVNPRALTARQTRFVAEYLIDLNATQAAIRAGYSPKRANQIAYENLRKPNVASAIGAGKERQLQTCELTAVRVLEEYRRIGFSDIGALVGDNGRLLPLNQLPFAVRAAIASVKLTKKKLTAGDGVVEDVVEVKLWDKVRSLGDLAKHFGLLEARVRVTADAELLARLRRGRENNAKGIVEPED